MIRVLQATALLLACGACQPYYAQRPIQVQSLISDTDSFYYHKPPPRRFQPLVKDPKALDEINEKIDHLQQHLDDLRARLTPHIKESLK